MDLIRQFFEETALENLQVPAVILNLILTLVLGQILSVHYRRFARVLSNKRKFAPMLVFIAATTMLVISVVKTSLSLSLGLVGALSIIRFRTPIKEPEELAYLFLSVAIGVGVGADQRVATTIMLFGILLFIAVSRRGRGQDDSARTLLHVSGQLNGKDRDQALQALLAEITPHASEVDLRRVDMQGQTFDSTMTVDLTTAQKIGPILDAIERVFPESMVSIVEADSLD